ncbi:YheC/YheD family protein [Paenibacillus tarimensis]|uniref:YheC/YheD family protein n=1 Tax=Paenibacillus tarimensis TaxID=416012 RepID=UPI001F3DDE02|nr:YheC/YheD family protein [Paenibacillus tarimensis]MCF2945561.1 YheC/YheD family protein [Paenibacillus tarimensis]
MTIRIVKSKLAKTKYLMSSQVLRQYIPVTLPLTKQALVNLLAHYHLVYVKPDLGKNGLGVMRVEQPSASSFRLRYGTHNFEFNSADDLYHAIEKYAKHRRYLIQQGIHLLTYQRRPFDIRVMVQQSPAGKWETTGIIGRVAHPDRIVTNCRSGGTAIAYNTLMSNYLTGHERSRLEHHLGKLGLEVAQHLRHRYPGIKEVGLDVALDSSFHPWLLEVNTLPNPFLFKKLKDKSVYQKISRYAAAYGRFSKRYCPEMFRNRKRKP